jgi:hypothetical protein
MLGGVRARAAAAYCFRSARRASLGPSALAGARHWRRKESGVGRLFGIVLLLATLWLGMRLWTQGRSALYAPAEPPVEELAEVEQAEEPATAPTRRQASPRRERVPITEYVRERASRDVQRGADRRARIAE